MPDPALLAVAAYADFLRFGRWPFPGELWEQRLSLVEELRTVHGFFTSEMDSRTRAAERRAKR